MRWPSSLWPLSGGSSQWWQAAGVTGPVERISAVTLVVRAMATSVAFYDSLGFERSYGGPDDAFTSYAIGSGYLNLQAIEGPPRPGSGWGRTVFWVADVDAQHRRALEAGHHPSSAPADAPWGERFFHLEDPDGHELSFARPLLT